MLMMLLQGKWGKAHKGKVLLCHPEGDAHPHLQLKTGSGLVVSTARVCTTLKPQVSSTCINHEVCCRSIDVSQAASVLWIGLGVCSNATGTYVLV